ncbi:MAG: Protein required for ethanol metabolism [Alyxoria varia]|nr:MAG: Protein required for ethanol metabolism [Alyxoria varia]
MKSANAYEIWLQVLFGTGDVIAQHAVEQRGIEKHDYNRTGRMLFYGGAIFGPAATKWFAFLPKAVRVPGRPNLEIFSRVMVDQCVFATANLGCFLSTMALLEGSSPKDKLKQNFLPALKKNWMVWPGVQIVNFKFVPLESRVLVVNCVALGWNCYLSFLASQGGATPKPVDLVPDT